MFRSVIMSIVILISGVASSSAASALGLGAVTFDTKALARTVVTAMATDVRRLAERVAQGAQSNHASVVSVGLDATIAVPRPAVMSHGAFDSVAIPVGNIAMASGWNAVTHQDHTAFFGSACEDAGFANCQTPFARAMQGIKVRAEGQSDVAKLKFVNRQVNLAMRYKSDAANWGVGDHWATPAEVARNGFGDCEDYAITKMWLLRSLGFTAEQLQLVVLQDTRRQLYHAVLVVHVAGDRYILDNLDNTARLDDAIGNYLPLVSFAGERKFLHGFDQRRSVMAAVPTDLASVHPGEGI